MHKNKEISRHIWLECKNKAIAEEDGNITNKILKHNTRKI